jgi:hypothetical protein
MSLVYHSFKWCSLGVEYPLGVVHFKRFHILPVNKDDFMLWQHVESRPG